MKPSDYLLGALLVAGREGAEPFLDAIAEMAAEAAPAPQVAGLGDPKGEAAKRNAQRQAEFVRSRLGKKEASESPLAKKEE